MNKVVYKRKIFKLFFIDELPPFHICGNLPFNISLPLLFRILSDISEQKNVFELGRIPLTFTFQHEVGEV